MIRLVANDGLSRSPILHDPIILLQRIYCIFCVDSLSRRTESHLGEGESALPYFNNINIMLLLNNICTINIKLPINKANFPSLNMLANVIFKPIPAIATRRA